MIQNRAVQARFCRSPFAVGNYVNRFGVRPPCRYAEDRQGLLGARGRSRKDGFSTVGAVCDRPYFIDYKKNARSQTASTVDTTNSADFSRATSSPWQKSALFTVSIVGAVCGRAFFLELTKCGRSQTAPTVENPSLRLLPRATRRQSSRSRLASN